MAAIFNRYFTAPTKEPASALWLSVFKAIENERSIDLRYRTAHTALQEHDLVPNYKIMKQLALKNQLGSLYRPLIIIALFLIPVLAVFQWLLSMFISAIHFYGASSANVHIIPTTLINIGLIKTAINTDPAIKNHSQQVDILDFGHLSGKLGLSDVLLCIASHILLTYHIIRADGRNRTDLLLHSRDAFMLLMLTCYAIRHSTHVFVTDDHYQRWAFLLSHYCEDFRIVQHGFLDSGVEFPNSFGKANTVYVRDPIFVPEFLKYYQIRDSRVFRPMRHLVDNPFSELGVFLASSFPSIDEEINFLTKLRASRNIPIIIKLHPAHTYDSRKWELLALASHVCSANDLPACQIFVSYNSFMEFDYKASGIPTFSIARLGGSTNTAEAIFSLLNQRQTQNHPL